METVIAIVFLIGAVILGSSAAPSEEGGSHEGLAAGTAQTASEHIADSRPCRYAGGRPVQRDLTVRRAPAVRLSGRPIKKSVHGCSGE